MTKGLTGQVYFLSEKNTHLAPFLVRSPRPFQTRETYSARRGPPRNRALRSVLGRVWRTTSSGVTLHVLATDLRFDPNSLMWVVEHLFLFTWSGTNKR